MKLYYLSKLDSTGELVMRICLCLSICMFISTTVFSATITVAQDGSGDVDQVQLAVAAANNGDEIVILDSGLYEEDVIAGAAAGFATQFTLKAMEGQTPTIRATNTAVRLESLGIPDPDLQGALFINCDGVLIENIIFENQTTNVNSSSTSSAVALLDCNNITLKDCTIRGAGGPGTEYSGFNFGFIVFGATLASKGIVLENCLVEECHFGIQVLKATAGVPTDPEITIRGCTIQNCNGNGIEMDSSPTPNPINPNSVVTGEGHLIEDTRIINCQNPATLGGGKITLRNCTLLGNRGFVNIDKQDTGELPIFAEFDNVAVIGSGDIGIRVIDGNLNLKNSIVAGCAREGLHVQENVEEVTVTVDHCDFYNNLALTPESFELRLDPAIGLDRLLVVRNTNVVGVAGIINGKPEEQDFFDEEAVTASFCNVMTEFETYINVTIDNDVSFDPQYINPSADPDLFTREGFQLQNSSQVLTAAADSGFIGSQGPVQTRIKNWIVH